MKNLQKFADRVHLQTGGNFFVDITYNSGRRSRTIKIGEVWIARLRLQEVYPNGNIENARFGFKHQRDMLDEIGDPFGLGKTPNTALADLLRCTAGKELLVTVGRKTHTVRVPANIAN